MFLQICLVLLDRDWHHEPNREKSLVLTRVSSPKGDIEVDTLPLTRHRPVYNSMFDCLMIHRMLESVVQVRDQLQPL